MPNTLEIEMSSLASNRGSHLGRPISFIDKSIQQIPFSMRCNARQTYLLIGAEHGEAKAFHQMEHIAGDRWSLTLRLQPGAYRFRYFAEHAAVTTYVRPDEAADEPIHMGGFDALLIVPTRPPYVPSAGIKPAHENVVHGYARGAV